MWLSTSKTKLVSWSTVFKWIRQFCFFCYYSNFITNLKSWEQR